MHEADGKCHLPPMRKDIRRLSLGLCWEYWYNSRRVEIPKYSDFVAFLHKHRKLFTCRCIKLQMLAATLSVFGRLRARIATSNLDQIKDILRILLRSFRV